MTSGLMNIAKSGMQAYQTALRVTSENVANADTDGYSRREVMTAESEGSVSMPFYNDSTGQGVLVDQIRRSFDELVTAQVRSTGAAVTSAETVLPALQQLEDRLLDDSGGITQMLSSFFESVESLASTPEDNGLRSVVLNAGVAFAGAVADMAGDVADLAENLHDQGEQVLDNINDLLSSLARTQNMISNSTAPGADNTILDRRDAMLTELSKQVEISVKYLDNNRVIVTLAQDDGAVLLDEQGAARITMNDDLTLNIRPSEAGSDPEDTIIRSVVGGRLHGLATGYNAISSTLSDLNSWAATVVDQMNMVHMASRDENGDPGGRMFSLNGWEADPAPAARGTTLASATEIEGETPPDFPIKLIYDDTAGLWNAYDDSNTLLGSGTDSITLTGIVIELTGNAVDGDVIDISPTHGEAQNMRFLLQEPEDLAAGGGLTISPSTANTGTADLAVSTIEVSGSYVNALSNVLPGNGATTTLISDGVVGLIPASATEVTLASLSTGGTASDIKIFTREGTQIAGTSLSAAEAAALLTTANGFANGAVYDDSLTGMASNYLGTQLSTDGSTASAQWLTLTDLPYEDLIVVAGAGDLEIGGNVTLGNGTEPDDQDVTLEVLDDTTGEVALYDSATGHRIGGGILDANGNVEIAGFSLTLEGSIATGDIYDIAATSSGTGDGRGLTALAALRSRDASSELGGFQALFTDIQTEVGGMVSAQETKLNVVEAQHETALKAQSEASGVDLDEEAASLLEYQQAYQANAKVMSIAQQLFTTLLNSF